MKTVILCAAFYGLGVFNCAVFAAVCLLHRPRYVAPTMRRSRDRLPEVRNAPPMPQVKPAKKPCIGCYGGDLPCVCRDRQTARDADGVNYQWLGVTGSEQE